MMTIFAFELLYFIKNIRRPVLLNRFVTSGARHIPVLAIQGEACLLVVKQTGGPEGILPVASVAGGKPVQFKLPGVDVAVALTAIGRQVMELLNLLSCLVFSEMAGPAGRPCVSTCQVEPGRVVIEPYLTPATFVVA
jgi:hypothetical protein